MDKLLADDQDMDDSYLDLINIDDGDQNVTNSLGTRLADYQFLSDEILSALGKFDTVLYATFYDFK